MTSRADLAAAVAATHARDLLPSRRVDDAGVPTRPCTMLDAYALGSSDPADDLGSGPWVAVVEQPDGVLLGVPLVATGAHPLTLRRAVPGDGVAALMLGRLLDDRPTVTVLTPFGLRRIDVGAVTEAPEPTEHGFDVDQTHDSVVVGDAVVVKWTVHLSPSAGEPHAIRMLSQLSAAGFGEVPAPIGFLFWRQMVPHVSEGGPVARCLLASVAAYLPGAEDGWDWYVDDLVDHISGATPVESVLAPATALGGLVARLHLALARPTEVEGTPVEASHPREGRRWRDAALRTLDEALAVTWGDPGDRLRTLAPRAREALDQLAEVMQTPLTLVHGDLHVGQVLRWPGGYALNDFDGNPVLSPEQQSAKQPPARDVGGMLQSLDHVGRIADRRTSGVAADAIEDWIADARAAFLAAYKAELAGVGMSRLLDERLLLPFAVEQECREYVYAARHLPHWVYVPDGALAALLPGLG